MEVVDTEKDIIGKISSTMVRNRIQDCVLHISGLVTKSTIEYIRVNGLYVDAELNKIL